MALSSTPIRRGPETEPTTVTERGRKETTSTPQKRQFSPMLDSKIVKALLDTPITRGQVRRAQVAIDDQDREIWKLKDVQDTVQRPGPETFWGLRAEDPT
ncbi:hypothetical protein DL763_009310 [Monosporascus cannonballus]|nr:hypothetical protein DL763_009310 [Monosporascus cannonballus]